MPYSLHRGLVVHLVLALAFAGMGGGCASYVTPGGPASFRAMGIAPDDAAAQTDFILRERLDKKPLAGFPTSIAVARVQGTGYRSYTENAYGTGKYSVVTSRTVETDQHLRTIGSLPMVRGVAMLNRLVLPDQLQDEKDLRLAAAAVHADMLLIYTFDTEFETGTTIPFLGTITLGVFPSEKAKVRTTVSAALLDTRNGYVYGLSQASADAKQLANAWTNSAAVDDCRKRTEQEAFDKLVVEFAGTWAGVVSEYGPKQTSGQTPTPNQ